MEATFYHDDAAANARNNDALKKLKSNMTLDFGKGGSKRGKVSTLLASPDLNMLKLASPELERLIIAQNGLMTTTPTPTQLLFPKSVTEEQEAYARGFVDALAELHQKEEGQPGEVQVSNASEFAAVSSAPVYADMVTLTSAQSRPTFTTTAPLPGSMMAQDALSQSAGSRTQSPLVHISNNPSPVPHFKEEPQTVPCMSLADGPVLSPIDMECQEAIKLDRKRARNRVAARKCRTRKLERIGRLEQRVGELKTQNAELTQTATQLRDQVCKLKEQIMQHVNSGCQVMLSNNLVNL